MPMTCAGLGCKATPENPKCTVWWMCLVRLGRFFAPALVTLIYVGAVIGLAVIVFGGHGTESAITLGGLLMTSTLAALNYVTRAFEHEENKAAIAEIKEAAVTSVKQNDVLIEKAKEIQTNVNGGLEKAKAESFQAGRQAEREGSNPG